MHKSFTGNKQKLIEEESQPIDLSAQAEYKVYKYRYVIMILEALGLFAHSLNYSFFSSIIPLIR